MDRGSGVVEEAQAGGMWEDGGKAMLLWPNGAPGSKVRPDRKR
jgi:hypothetical protein